MNTKRASSLSGHGLARLVLLVGALGCAPRATAAVGTWTNVIAPAPGPVELMLLLSDGTVMAQQAGISSNWFRLTPDQHGSYITGSWTTIASMLYSRQFYSSAVLRDGRVFVAGGEYGTGGTLNTAEIYDPRYNVWTEIPVPAGTGFSDSDCVILPDGRLLIAPVTPATPNATIIYDPGSNSFSPGPAYYGNQNEATWVKLPDDSILTIDAIPDATALNTSERFIPSLNNGQGQWIADRQLPVAMYNSSGETGAGVLLPDGRAWFLGGNGHTAYYTPSGNTNQGIWTPGPDMPAPGVGWDEPAAMMVNGKVLYQTFIYPIQTNNQARGYFELDPAVNYPLGAITEVTPEWGDISGTSHIMLNLPDGNVLVSYGNSTLRVYQPGGVPVVAGKPTIISITPNPDGSYHLTGRLLNGISQGSSFGDDAQMDSNYPLVKLTDPNTGIVYFGRTFNWSSTSVATGSRITSTEFTVPQAVAKVAYSLVVIANGISSDPVTFYGPVWVDFNYNLPLQAGTFDYPYNPLSRGILNLGASGAIFIKGPGSSSETMTISTPMIITAFGGAVTIGH